MRTRAIALAAAISCAACSGASGSVPVAPGASVPAATSAAGQSANSPCDVTNAWYFHGSCATFAMNAGGSTVRLAPYHGVTLGAHWTANNAQPNDAFVTGDAIGRADITGTFAGRRFTPYGAVGCVDPGFNPTSCPGRAFLYSFTQNASANSVGWNSTPAFHIANARAFPGTTCQLINLVSGTTSFLWMRLPVYGTPAGGRLTLNSWTSVLGLSPSKFYVFGFICY